MLLAGSAALEGLCLLGTVKSADRFCSASNSTMNVSSRPSAQSSGNYPAGIPRSEGTGRPSLLRPQAGTRSVQPPSCPLPSWVGTERLHGLP